MVAQPAPVFVDSTGRRRRLLRRFAYGFTAFCMMYGGLISLSLAGGPVSPSAVLPLPGLVDGGEPPTGNALPRPEPVVTAPKSVLVNEATTPRTENVGSWDGGTVATRRATARPTGAAAPVASPTTDPTSATRPVEGTPTSTRTPPTVAPTTATPGPRPSPTVSRDAPGSDTGGGPVDVDPDDTDPGSTDPGDTDPGNTDPGDVEPGDTDPGDTEPDDVDRGTGGAGGGSADECPDLVPAPSKDRTDRSAGADASVGSDASPVAMDVAGGGPGAVPAVPGAVPAVPGAVPAVPGASGEALSLLVGSASPLAATDSAFGAAMQIAAYVGTGRALPHGDARQAGGATHSTETASTDGDTDGDSRDDGTDSGPEEDPL